MIDIDKLEGTPFQKKVWKAVLDIPWGETRSYQQIALAIGQPQAVRAVGNALGENPLAVQIPCHRVIRSDGQLGGYRWGLSRKEELLKLESSEQV